MVCFSRKWQNPLLWSHYADKHKGLCLGFDVVKSHTLPIIYRKNRKPCQRKEFDIDFMLELLSTKYTDWSYEDETRLFCLLEKPCKDTGLYFLNYSNDLILKEIIIGCQSDITRQDISNVMEGGFNEVKPFKVRPAYNTFKIVKNRNESLWK